MKKTAVTLFIKYNLEFRYALEPMSLNFFGIANSCRYRVIVKAGNPLISNMEMLLVSTDFNIWNEKSFKNKF